MYAAISIGSRQCYEESQTSLVFDLDLAISARDMSWQYRRRRDSSRMVSWEELGGVGLQK